MAMFKDDSNKLAIIALVAIVLLLVWRSGPAASGQATDRGITVSSTSTIEAQPDKAEVYLKVETLNANPQQSQDDNSRISDAVMKALAFEGVEKKDIETSQYYLDQKIRYGRDGEQIIDGYVTVHVLKVTTTETADVGTLIDASVNAGANGVNNIVFTLSDGKRAELRKQAIQEASAEAREKAENIAKGLGVKLGKLQNAAEQSFSVTPYYAYAPMAAEKAGGPTQIQPQTVQVSATLNVAYSIA